MPIYEYRCEECGHVFEEIQRFSDPDPEKCPSCGSGEVGRIISRTSFQLKGGGWYAQEYSSSPATAKSDTSSSTTSPATPASAPAASEPKSSPASTASSTTSKE